MSTDLVLGGIVLVRAIGEIAPEPDPKDEDEP